MERDWKLTDAQICNPLGLLFNVSPTAIVAMLCVGDDGRLEQVAARRGLIPFWRKESKPPRNTFNTRSEEAATKPMWRIPASKAHCLLPTMGWYEWNAVDRVDLATGEVKTAKQPYYMQRADDEPIAFAGFMSRRTLEGDKSEFTCTILTRDAVGPAAAAHIRMPIGLRKEAEAAWLNPGLSDAAKAVEFARERAISDFVLQPVGTGINDGRIEAADLIESFHSPVRSCSKK